MSPVDPAAVRDASEWFALLQGPDAVASRAEFDEWLSASPENRRAYSQVTDAYILAKNLRAGSSRAASVGLAGKRTKKLGVALVLALIGAAIGATAVQWFERQGLAPVAPVEQRERTRLSTRVGEIRPIRLSDGSVVTVDTDSEVREEFSSSQRDVVLVRGRARFEVSHEGRPFVVHAGQSTVTAHGTIFDVRFESGHVAVRLLRGSVDVALAKQPAVGKQLTRLTPGDAVSADVASGVTRLVSSNASQIAQSDWPGALLEFDHVALNDLVSEANRYSSHKIQIRDDRTGSILVSGTFKVGDPARLADGLATLLGLQALREPSGDVVLMERVP